MSTLVHWLDIAGVVAFALSGVIVACRSHMDPFGMLVLAAVTGIGGGTLRDLILGHHPVFWVAQPIYLWSILITVMLAMLGFHHIHRLDRRLLPAVDAFGLALFTVLGARQALDAETPVEVAVLMGLLTGIAGGMVRDVLARRVPMVLRREIYATASIAGGCLYVLLRRLDIDDAHAMWPALLVTLILRLAAIRWHWSLPTFAWVTTGGEEGDARWPMHRQRPRVRIIRPQRSRDEASDDD
ncbi:trimeric intracellular cation channel family protein [Kushneria phosphatilytica]|uniref:Trimeric intracellular cation channel family protein n=1 Tax=Kushneria phosphatilytica TaxID=657387 RepID=A0A1S1NU87_9GAMM|nr:trimeric intracellular cation channel family protein [Kushneria phosphatilytica]OHV08181.1 hypothetical protein BH688_14465 [Kushneria phosphatilytica]QEL09924.1 trimeric intracellular cation channel family protein [Kushneria phosphatilytica]